MGIFDTDRHDRDCGDLHKLCNIIVKSTLVTQRIVKNRFIMIHDWSANSFNASLINNIINTVFENTSR